MRPEILNPLFAEAETLKGVGPQVAKMLKRLDLRRVLDVLYHLPTGAIERITFHNLDNGYCVLRVRAAGHRDVVTVVGHLSQAVAGEYVEAEGTWVTDRNHGQQFKADTLKTTPPHTAEGIAKYLGSGRVKGIGPKYAKKIVDVFGKQTLDVIEKSPGYLAQVKGIGPTLAAIITLELNEGTAGRGALLAAIYCFGLGVPFVVAALAYRRVLGAFSVVRRHQKWVTRIGGVMLVAVGIALLTGFWDQAVSWLQIHLVSDSTTAV